MRDLDRRIEAAGGDIIKLTELIVDEVDSYHRVYEGGGGEQIVKRVEATRENLILLLITLTGREEKDIKDLLKL